MTTSRILIVVVSALVACALTVVPPEQHHLGYRPQRPDMHDMCPDGMVPLKCETSAHTNPCTLVGSEVVVATVTFGTGIKTVVDWNSTAPVAVVIIKCALRDNVYAYWPEATKKPPGSPSLECSQHGKDISHVGMCIIPRIDVAVDASASDSRVHDWNVTKAIDPTHAEFIGGDDGTVYSVDARVAFSWWSTYRVGSHALRVSGVVELFNRWSVETTVARVIVHFDLPSHNVSEMAQLLADADPDLHLGPNQTYCSLPPFSFVVHLDDGETAPTIPIGALVVEAITSDALFPCYPFNGSESAYLEWITDLVMGDDDDDDDPKRCDDGQPPCGWYWASTPETLATTTDDGPCVVVTDQAISCDVVPPFPVGAEVLVADSVVCPAPSEYAIEKFVTFSLITHNVSYCDLARVRGVPSSVAGEGQALPPWEIPNTFALDDDPARIDVVVIPDSDVPTPPCVIDGGAWTGMSGGANLTADVVRREYMTDEDGNYVTQMVVGAISSDADPPPNGLVPIDAFVFAENAAPPFGVPPPLHTLIANTSDAVRTLLDGTWSGAESCIGLASIRVRLISQLVAAELNVAAISRDLSGGECADFAESELCDAIGDGHAIVAAFGCEDWADGALVVPFHPPPTGAVTYDGRARQVTLLLELWNGGCMSIYMSC